MNLHIKLLLNQIIDEYGVSDFEDSFHNQNEISDYYDYAFEFFENNDWAIVEGLDEEFYKALDEYMDSKYTPFIEGTLLDEDFLKDII